VISEAATHQILEPLNGLKTTYTLGQNPCHP